MTRDEISYHILVGYTDEILAHDAAQRQTIEQQAARIKELEARLCIDYCYVYNPAEPDNPTKQKLSEEEKRKFPDQIVCLEADVQLRDEEISRLEAELARVKGALEGILNKDQERLRVALRSGDPLRILAEALRLFNDCRDLAEAALQPAREEGETNS